jgi:hypothetical protein
MKIQFYKDTDSFAADALDILLENEVQNNFPISFMSNKTDEVSKWLMATIKDDSGGVVLTAACTPPFNIILYETRNIPNYNALNLLVQELPATGFTLPGVLAEQGLANRFAEAYARGNFQRKVSMSVMRLDKISEFAKSSGTCRLATENDLFFLPYWSLHFGLELNLPTAEILVYDMLQF